MVIIISSPILFGLCLALAVPYIVLGIRSLATRAARPIPERHGLRDLGKQ
jgi:hypothetical protein